MLGIAPATWRDRRIALAVAAVLLAAFALTAPVADTPLRGLPGFVTAYDAAIIVLDLITAQLLYTQYRELQLRSLLVLSCAYVFTPPLVAFHALAFPDAFAPGHLVGGPQTTAWLWMAWHGVFPLFVIAYAVCARRERAGLAAAAPVRAGPAFGLTCALSLLLVGLTTLDAERLPVLMLANRYESPATKWVLTLGWVAHVLALGMVVAATRLRRLLDLWISVMLLAGAIDLALSALLVDARYQLGFYVGRLYGLLASSFVLALLLRAASRLQAGMARTWQALRASEVRFRTLANTAPALIWRSDAQGRNVFMNQCFLDFTGCSPDDTGGNGWPALAHPDDAPAIAAYTAAARERRSWHGRLRIRRHDGQWRWLDYFAHPLPDEGEDGGHVGVAIDVTDMVDAEDALKTAARRKDEFLATLAHELRNPLAPISTGLQLLRHVQAGERRAADRIIAVIDRQAGHMVRLVDDLLEIARISNGKIRLERECVDLVGVLRGAVESSMPLIDQGRHTLALDLPAQPLWVDGDAVRLGQVFANLLNNAAKYTDDGGRIVLEARAGDGQAVVTVRDNGIGIPPGMLGDVFELYRQVPETTHRGQGGLGIGLAMVRQLVDMHGGTVDVHSDGQRRGSEFTVRLPLVQAPSAPAPGQDTPAPAARSLHGCQLLIVDDNVDAATTLAEVLAADGAEVRVAHDGSAALAELERYRPRAVLLDIGLPDISGYDVARRIRARPALRGLRLIAVTGWGQHEDRLKSHDCGFDEHLTKPVDVARLEALLTAAPADQAASR